MPEFSLFAGAAPVVVTAGDDGGVFTNTGPSTVYYAADKVTTTAFDGSLAPNASVTLYGAPQFVIGRVSEGGVRADMEYVLLSKSGEIVNTVAASGAAQTIRDASINNITLTAACTLTFPTLSVGRAFSLILVQDATGSRTVTWPTVSWPGGTPPTLTTTATKRDVFTFLSVDGSTWLGFTAGANL